MGYLSTNSKNFIMSKKIFKYDLFTHGPEKVLMLEGAKILCLKSQHGSPKIWAIVDTEAHIEERTFITVGTGHPYPENLNLRYIDTYQLSGGLFVYHVFELL